MNLDTLFDELDSYLELEEDWDGEGATVPTQKKINQAKLVLCFAQSSPEVAPMFDGGICLFWREREITVHLHPTTLSIVANKTYRTVTEDQILMFVRTL